MVRGREIRTNALIIVIIYIHHNCTLKTRKGQVIFDKQPKLKSAVQMSDAESDNMGSSAVNYLTVV